MLYYNRIDISEGIDLTNIITTVKNVRFVIIGFLIMDIYKSLNINIGRVMKNMEMLKFVADHLKTKKM